jgi:hypothetical protein
MKRLIYQVYVGKKSKLYNHCTASVKKYAKDIGVDYVCQKTPILMIRPDPFTTNRSKDAVERLGYLPIYEKENAFTYLKNYDQIAIIDSDVWIRPDSPNVFDTLDPSVDFGGVVERDMPILNWYKTKITNYSKMQYSTIKNVDWDWNDRGGEFFNMGVMLLNKSILKYLKEQTPAQFLKRTRFKPFIDGIGNWKWSTDQTLLNTWVKEENMKLHKMDYKWNALYTALEPDALKQAYFVHFFLKDKLPQRGENIEELMKNVNK